ncbi:MAG: hypothetical protein JWP87_6408 [Labilithrix sp.]|nr:hypothetical protein [Labilithrix sp.]
MSLLLAGLIVAGTSGAVAIGRWLSRRRENSNEPKPDVPDAANAPDAGEANDEQDKKDEKDDAATPKKAGGAAPKPPKRRVEGPHAHLEGFPCQLGDVVMRLTGEEAWLAGGLVLSEEAPIAALFVAPDAGHDCAIYVRPQPREAVFWMEPLDPGAILVGGEPPSSVEHRGIRFDRVRRLPLRPRRIGVGAPDVGDAVVLAEYSSAGAERLLVMRSASGTSHAYRGEELEVSSYEVIASGKSTLDE